MRQREIDVSRLKRMDEKIQRRIEGRKRKINKIYNFDVIKSTSIGPVMISPTKFIDNLGTIDFKYNGFHTNNYIYPIGYRSRLVKQSTIHPTGRCVYTNQILCNNENEPMFVVICSDFPGWRCEANNPIKVWKIAAIETHYSENSQLLINGFDQFGLTHFLVRRSIEYLPRVEYCTKYLFRYRILYSNYSIKKKKKNKFLNITKNIIQSQKFSLCHGFSKLNDIDFTLFKTICRNKYSYYTKICSFKKFLQISLIKSLKLKILKQKLAKYFSLRY